MEGKPSRNPVDQKPSALSGNPEVHNPAASSEIGTDEISDNPSRVLVEVKVPPGTSTDDATTSDSHRPDTPEHELSRFGYQCHAIPSRTESILPENATDPAVIIENISGAKSDISSGSPTYSDADLFRSPKIPSILVTPPGSPVDPEISNPPENPTDPDILNPSENTPRGPSATQASQSQSVRSSILLGITLYHIICLGIPAYTLISITVATGINYDSGCMMAIYGLFVVLGIGAVLLLKCCYGIIAQIIADYRGRKELPSNTSNPSPPENLKKAETTESEVDGQSTETLYEKVSCIIYEDDNLSEKDEDGAQEVVQKLIDLTQEKETVRLRHVGAENK